MVEPQKKIIKNNETGKFISVKLILLVSVIMFMASVCDNKPPVAVITGGDRSIGTHIPVSFDGSQSYDPDGNVITQYFWTFGDSGSASGDRVTHVYNSPGTYKVTLFVRDRLETGKTTCTINAVLDSDGDGLSDFDEIRVIFRTNAVDTKTWHDGVDPSPGWYGPNADGRLDYLEDTWIVVHDGAYFPDGTPLSHFEFEGLGNHGVYRASWANSVQLGPTVDNLTMELFDVADNAWHRVKIYQVDYSKANPHENYYFSSYVRPQPERADLLSELPMPEYAGKELYYKGTDPNNPDTDGDGIPDGNDPDPLHSPIKAVIDQESITANEGSVITVSANGSVGENLEYYWDFDDDGYYGDCELKTCTGQLYYDDYQGKISLRIRQVIGTVVVSDTVSIPCNIINVAPQPKIKIGDAVCPDILAKNENEIIQLNADPNDPGKHDNWKYEWDMNNDGIYEWGGQGWRYSPEIICEPTGHVINLRVIDKEGAVGTDSLRIDVTHQNPTANSRIVVPEDDSHPFTWSIHTDGWWYVSENVDVILNGKLSSASGGASISTYEWYVWKIGAIAPQTPTHTGIEAAHNFTTKGEYNVKLVVTDELGSKGNITTFVSARLDTDFDGWPDEYDDDDDNDLIGDSFDTQSRVYEIVRNGETIYPDFRFSYEWDFNKRISVAIDYLGAVDTPTVEVINNREIEIIPKNSSAKIHKAAIKFSGQPVYPSDYRVYYQDPTNLHWLLLSTNPAGDTGYDTGWGGGSIVWAKITGDSALLNNRFKLKPISGDTDNDGLSDGLEGQLGSDPTISDSDGDGLDDRWEWAYFYKDDGAGGYESIAPQVCNNPIMTPDSDEDGLSDYDEISYNGDPYDYRPYNSKKVPKLYYDTDALNEDTDGDGIKDGMEKQENTWAIDKNDNTKDSDKDGLFDGDEYYGDTDPRTGKPRDTDKIENLNHYKTDPNKKDTDGDGSWDGLGADNNGDGNYGDGNWVNGVYLGTNDDPTDHHGELTDGTHPLNYNSNHLDSDGDGIYDSLEELGWTIAIYYEDKGCYYDDGTSKLEYVDSDKYDKDTDDDGLTDYEEYLTNFNSNPRSSDTDKDYISDSDEIQYGRPITGIDCETPSLFWSVKGGEVHVLDGGLISVDISISLDAYDLSYLDRMEIKIKTNPWHGGKPITESLSHKDIAGTMQRCTINAKYTVQPRNSYDVIFIAKDMVGNQNTVTHHIASGWETFVDILNQAANAVYESTERIFDSYISDYKFFVAQMSCDYWLNWFKRAEINRKFDKFCHCLVSAYIVRYFNVDPDDMLRIGIIWELLMEQWSGQKPSKDDVKADAYGCMKGDIKMDPMGVAYWCYKEYRDDPHGFNNEDETVKVTMDYYMQDFKDNFEPQNFPLWWPKYGYPNDIIVKISKLIDVNNNLFILNLVLNTYLLR